MTAIGIGEKKLGTFQLDFITSCPWCKRNGALEMVVNQDYLAFLFVPIVPAGKSGKICCTDCNYEKQQTLFSREELAEFKNYKKKTTTPIWMVSGLFAILAYVLIMVYFFSKDNRPQQGFTALENRIRFPEKGDLFQVRWEDRDYSWFKIDSVNQDSVWVLHNLSSTPIPVGLSAIRNDEYDTLLESYSRKELKVMYVERQIRDVIRAKK